MEGSSHSRTFSHHSRSHSRAQVLSGPTTFSGSKKPPIFPNTGNNGGFFTTSYDDVFGGPPTFAALAPRAEDYSEIFGAFRSSSSSRASSIPVLDLPAVADIDAGASFLDYSEVFGGFEAVDFAVPYDELFRPFDAGDCSSDEAWTPVGTESLSDDSDPFAFSEKSPCYSDGNSHQSLDNKHFNVSYHKVNLGTSTSVSNMTHIAQLNAVPGYTCVVDEPASLEQMVNERLYSTTGDDIILNVDSSVFSQKHPNQTMSHMLHHDDAVKSFDENHRSGRARSVNMTNVNSTFASVSDINLRTESSHLPPPFRPPSVPAERKGDSNRLKSDPKGSENCCLDVNDIPFFDMEFDASSSAAASAAAMKDAMEKAHTKLKAAKVLMDRKKDSLQNGEDLGLKTDLNGGERVQMVQNECASKDERLPAASHRASAKIKISGEDRPTRNASSILPNDSAVEQRTGLTENPAERKNGKKHSSFVETAFTEGVGEWKEARQYYEFVNNDSANLASLCPSNCGLKTETCKQLDNDKYNSDSTDEVCVPEENRRRLKTTKAVSRQEYYEKMVKVAQEVHNTMIGGHVEAAKRLDDVPLGNPNRQEGKLEKRERQAQQVQVEKPFEPIRKEEEIWSKNALEKEEIKQKENHSHYREQSDRNRNSPHQSRVQEVVASMEEDRRMRESYEWEYCEGRTQDSFLREEDEPRVKEACEGQRKHKNPAGSTNQKKYNGSLELKNNLSREAFDVGFDGKVQQTASESHENDKMKDLQRRKVEENRKKEASDGVVHVERLQKTCQSHQRNVDDKRSKEALEDIFNGERLSRTSEGEENVKTKGLLQINEYENRAKDAVEGQGTRKTFEEVVELEDKKVPEQKKIKQRLYEAQKLGLDSRESEKARLANSPREGRADGESIQTGELEETCKFPDNTSDNENQKTMHKSQVKIDQVDVDQEPNSSPETELSSQDVKLPTGAKLNEKDFELVNATFKLKVGAHDFLEVPAQKDNGEINPAPVASDKENDYEAVETADVLIDERPTKSTVSQVGATDNEHKTSVHPPDCLYTKDSNATSDEVYSGKGQSHEDKKDAPSASDPKLAKDFEIGWEEKRNVLEGQVLYDEEAKCTQDEGITGWSGQLRKKEVANTAMPKRKESIPKRSEQPTSSQSIERKAKIVTKEKNKEKERDLEQEQLRKLEEEREREREREKDRMAVEIAIREARERAYTDARDRAERTVLERATDEARQRAMVEARERLEKACAEARERSLADKASDARLRAERFAVERATAEARQRAIEKVMVERATLEARERMQRSVSEKYSSSSEREVTRQSSMPSISERFEADVEPAQRCKARLERHRRTVERVAKALAEKNMRDLLAQREQAEKNRFAETLDADIKRWSSGKEGNLRALLSTLQYILGPDSGWQPIPLTEVITAAAVKRAYRKATLCVHPDKLQQRGASVQHKYICEKVFDLLKEAWSSFNSEEK